MIAQFALRLVVGMSLTWCVMPRSQVTAGFFRIQMLVALGLMVLAAMTVEAPTDPESGEALLETTVLRLLCVAAACCAYAGSVLWTLARRSGGAALGGAVACLSLAVLIGSLPLRGAGSGPAGIWLTILSEISSAWLIGGATSAMLLGHWYLTATEMSLAPLHRLNRYLGAAALTRGVLAGAAVLTLSDASLDKSHVIWLILRWSAGVIGPLVMCVLVSRILRYRNTQSATGVLFAGVILTIIGETAAALLYRDLRWPL